MGAILVKKENEIGTDTLSILPVLTSGKKSGACTVCVAYFQMGSISLPLVNLLYCSKGDNYISD